MIFASCKNNKKALEKKSIAALKVNWPVPYVKAVLYINGGALGNF